MREVCRRNQIMGLAGNKMEAVTSSDCSPPAHKRMSMIKMSLNFAIHTFCCFSLRKKNI